MDPKVKFRLEAATGLETDIANSTIIKTKQDSSDPHSQLVMGLLL